MPTNRSISRPESESERTVRIEAEDAARKARSAELRRVAAPIVQDLREAGYEISSLWTLEGTDAELRDAYPILASHLDLKYPDRIANLIGQLLAHPGAIRWWGKVRVLYSSSEDGLAKDGLAVALSGMAGKPQLGELLDLIKDAHNGESRISLLRKTKRLLGKEVGLEFARSLANDPQLGIEAKRMIAGKAPND